MKISPIRTDIPTSSDELVCRVLLASLNALYATAYRLTGAADIAEGLVQETAGVDHNVGSQEGRFREFVLGGVQNKAVDWTALPKPGDVQFVCTYHRGMEMTVNAKQFWSARR